MARRLFVHVGPPKTGTSFLQAAWFQHRSELAASGLLYPGEQVMAQFRASAVALRKDRITKRYTPRELRSWDELTSAAADWEQDALLSSEHYAIGGDAGAARVLDRLRAIADEIHLLVTCRDLARQVLASWQQGVKQGNDETFDHYWRSLAAEESGGFWRAQDLPTMIQRWSAGVPAARVHLVTHGRPGSGPSPLWDRVCAVLGVDPGILQPVTGANESLGAVQIELIRRANAELPGDRDRIAMGRMTKTFVAHDIVGPIGESHPLTLPPQAQEWAARRSASMRDALRDRGYHVVGDLDDLVSDATPRPGRTPDSVSDQEVAAIAGPAVARFMQHEVRRREADRRQRQELRRLRRAASAGSRQGGPESAPPSPGWRRVASGIRRRIQRT